MNSLITTKQRTFFWTLSIHRCACNAVFSELDHYFFSNFFAWSQVSMNMKEWWSPSFQKSSSGPRINIFELFSKFVHWNFLNCTWWQTLKIGLKWLFWIFKGNSYFSPNGVNEAFFWPKINNICEVFLKYVH